MKHFFSTGRPQYTCTPSNYSPPLPFPAYQEISAPQGFPFGSTVFFLVIIVFSTAAGRKESIHLKNTYLFSARVTTLVNVVLWPDM